MADASGKHTELESELIAALTAISEMRRLTLIAPSLGEDGDRAHQIGANKAFGQAADIASSALRKATEAPNV